MWLTGQGERKLEGCERELFIRGVISLFGNLAPGKRDGQDFQTGVRAFDGITCERRPWALLCAAEMVLGDAPPAVPTAWSEGSILAVFEHIRAMGMDQAAGVPEGWKSSGWIDWAQEIKRVWRKLQRLEEPKPGNLSLSPDEDLTAMIECLRGRLLKGDDCEMASMAMNLDPGVTHETGGLLGIPDTYFVNEPPRLSAAVEKVLLKNLQDWSEELSGDEQRDLNAKNIHRSA